MLHFFCTPSRESITAIFVTLFSTVLAGCSTHPLPDDVARRSTYQIVEAIRCEAKNGLKGFEQSHLLDHAKIGYDFEFVITEENKLSSGTLDIKSALASFTLASVASAEKTRSNTRAFRIIEPLRNLKMADCTSAGAPKNLAYPISGKIGVDEIVSTYLRLEALSASSLGDTVQKTHTGLFSDTLTFTTNLTAGTTPTLKIEAPTGGFKVSGAGVNANTKRNDQHLVVIVLLNDPKLAPMSLRTSRIINRAASANYNALATAYSSRTHLPIINKELDDKDQILTEFERQRLIRERLAFPQVQLQVLTP